MKTLNLKPDTFNDLFTVKDRDGIIAQSLKDCPFYEIKTQKIDVLKNVCEIIVTTDAWATQLATPVKIHYSVEAYDDLTLKLVMIRVVFEKSEYVKDRQLAKMVNVND